MEKPKEIKLSQLDSPALEFLDAEEVVFLLIRGRSTPVSLLGTPEEVFGRHELRLVPVAFRPIDYLGRPCLHSKLPVDDPGDMVVCFRAREVVAVLRETCFKKWFVLQDKPGLGNYRFASLRPSRLVSDDGMTRFRKDGELSLVQEVVFDALVDEDYTTGIRESTPDAEPAFVRAQASLPAESGGTPDDENVVFCPRCDQPNRMSFLDMTATPHVCVRCQGRFGVRVVEL